MSNEKKTLIVLALAGILFVSVFVIEHYFCLSSYRLFLFLVPYLIAGFPVLKKSLQNIFEGEIFDENFLMALATIGAFCIGEFPEAVAVMLFYQLGEFFSELAVKKSTKAISDLLDITPEHAWKATSGGTETSEWICVSPQDVQLNDVILVKVGERVPLDGEIILGETQLDTSALTGESLPTSAQKGSIVLSGSMNLVSPIQLKVLKTYENSTATKITKLVQDASLKKAPTEKFITAFSKVYTPIVVFLAVAVAVLPPLFDLGTWTTWIHRSLLFLVISCPCALVVSVPLTLFCGMGCSSKNGVLVKGSNYLEALSHLDTIVFDKTGTLTTGKFSVTKIIPYADFSEEEILLFAASIESKSNHPLAQAVVESFADNSRLMQLQNVVEFAGKGMRGEILLTDQNYFANENSKTHIRKKTLQIGNLNFIKSFVPNLKELEKIENVDETDYLKVSSSLFVALDDTIIGVIKLADTIKENATHTIKKIQKLGCKKVVMLTGDKKDVADSVAKKLNIDFVKSELLPADKVYAVEELLKEMTSSTNMYNKKNKKTLAFVGDGINDAPVLSLAPVGIAMGVLGSDIAIEASDVVIMDDSILKIPLVVKIAKKTLFLVKENVGFSLIIKFLFMALGVVGIANMWMAVFADVGVTLLAILNGTRSFRIRSPNDKSK